MRKGWKLQVERVDWPGRTTSNSILKNTAEDGAESQGDLPLPPWSEMKLRVPLLIIQTVGTQSYEPLVLVMSLRKSKLVKTIYGSPTIPRILTQTVEVWLTLSVIWLLTTSHLTAHCLCHSAPRPQWIWIRPLLGTVPLSPLVPGSILVNSNLNFCGKVSPDLWTTILSGFLRAFYRTYCSL